MPEPLRVLILDDNPSDAELMVHEVRRAGFDPNWRRVDTEAAYTAALGDAPDVILADYSLPGFDAFRALQHLRERQLDIPCLVVTGAIGDELAAECIKQGACDYLLKDRLARLGVAVRGALARRRLGIEKRRAEEALRERSEQLRVLAAELTLTEQRERRRLAAVLHDDLQQLLVGARLRLDPVRRAPEEVMRQTAAEVEELISQSLTLARTLARELDPPILHEGGLIPALEWLGRRVQEKYGLQVKLTTEGPAPEASEGHRVLLFQAVRELLLNVIKHAKVTTASVQVDRLGDQLRVQVGDDGVGFDPAELRAEGGSAGGVGLFAIRERLDLLGGRLEIKAAPGTGSRFTLLAPLEPSADRDTAARAQPVSRRKPEGRVRGGGKGVRVLVVDDHAIVRQGLVRLLAAEPDIEVVGEASDGRTAVDLTRQVRPDVVIMDVSMRGMNGVEATRVIHAELPAVQVIGLSMYDEAEKGLAMREAGAVNYLSKVGPSDVLLDSIRACDPRHRRRAGEGEGSPRRVRGETP